jgi:hypothetical protein
MPSSYQLCLWKQESFLVLKAFFRSLLEVGAALWRDGHSEWHPWGKKQSDV